MAETKKTPQRKAPAAKRTSTARRQTTRTKSDTAAKRRAASRANSRTQARARQAERKVEGRLDQAQQLAERAVLVQVGAALEARDRVVSTVSDIAETYTSRSNAQKRMKKLERRGATARTRVERELRQRVNRIERAVKRNESKLEREVEAARKDVARDGKGLRRNISANAGLVSAQVANVAQTGITAGAKIVSGATERVAS